MVVRMRLGLQVYQHAHSSLPRLGPLSHVLPWCSLSRPARPIRPHMVLFLLRLPKQTVITNIKLIGWNFADGIHAGACYGRSMGLPPTPSPRPRPSGSV